MVSIKFLGSWLAALAAVALTNNTGVSAQNETVSVASLSSSSSSNWKFSPVTLVQARVQGNLPVWDAE
ncbi:hypothetical protein Gpo141_00014479, partial [Globisporangium polare]